MKELYFFGDFDSCLAVPFRVCTHANCRENERLWMKLEIDNVQQVLSYIASKFDIGEDGVINKPVQHILELMKSVFIDGVFYNRLFKLTIYESTSDKSVLVISRSTPD